MKNKSLFVCIREEEAYFTVLESGVEINVEQSLKDRHQTTKM